MIEQTGGAGIADADMMLYVTADEDAACLGATLVRKRHVVFSH